MPHPGIRTKFVQTSLLCAARELRACTGWEGHSRAPRSPFRIGSRSVPNQQPSSDTANSIIDHECGIALRAGQPGSSQPSRRSPQVTLEDLPRASGRAVAKSQLFCASGAMASDSNAKGSIAPSLIW